MTALSSIESQTSARHTLLKGERMVAHNLVVGGGTIVAGLLGVAFQSLASHQLKPADYGGVFAVITLMTFIGLPAGAFTLLMARETSRGQASGHEAASANLLRRGNRALLLFGVVITGLIALTSNFLSLSLRVPAELLLVGCASIPFGLALPLLLGELQGEQRFVTFTLLMAGQAALKLVAAIALGLVFGAAGIVGGISLATLVTYLVVTRLLMKRLAVRANAPWWRPAARYLTIALPSTLSLAVLLSADVLLVKHYFPTHLAGQYAAVAALGRAIFWGASGVATVLFPKVVTRTTHGRSGSPLVGASLVLVAVGGFAGLGALTLGAHWLLTAFAGGAYSDAAAYLPWYAVGMTILGGVAVLIAAHQSHGHLGFLGILIPLTLVEPVLMIAMHHSLRQVVQVLDGSVAVVFIGLGALYIAQERTRRFTFAPSNPGPTSDQLIPDLAHNL